ncbi:MAG: uracil-DNA glycosylase family protein [Yoonia sp.]|nr:uracil-DNA glycosylase family protein [Yoonia sp.]
MTLNQTIAACKICVDRFSSTATAHQPRPIVWFEKSPRIVIAGQAPGARVHQSGKPFTDPSGDRLREWMGVTSDRFYDRSKVAIVPMSFCFPGYNDAGHDLAPPKICAATWRSQVMDYLGAAPLTLLVGGHAQVWHLGDNSSVHARVSCWRDHAPRVFPLPHPSWRNTGWLKKNPWFADALLPALQTAVKDALDD